MRRILMIFSLLCAAPSAIAAPLVQTEAPTMGQPPQMVELAGMPYMSKPDTPPQVQPPKRHAAADSRYYWGACAVHLMMIKTANNPSVTQQIYSLQQFANEGCAPDLLLKDPVNRHMRCVLADMGIKTVMHENRKAGYSSSDIPKESMDRYDLYQAQRKALQC